MNHDIVTIGGSAGAVDVLLELAQNLPADLAAAVFVVVHMPPGYQSELPRLLTHRGRLPALHPFHGDTIERGKIYVAPSDMHIQLRPGLIEVIRGPRENGHRPAIDALFRTASNSYGSRVIGVVLSGYQDCGTAGMISIKARGGLSVVQDPASAAASEMPRSVLEKVEVDHVVHPPELPRLLAKLVATTAPENREPAKSVHQLEGTELGTPANVVCPICNGVLTESQPGVFEHFRCHVGHAFSLQSLIDEQGDQLERALWAAIRALEESAALAERLAITEHGELQQRFVERARSQRAQAEMLRRAVVHGEVLSSEDAAKLR